VLPAQQPAAQEVPGGAHAGWQIRSSPVQDRPEQHGTLSPQN
jgi:hypothetical protein